MTPLVRFMFMHALVGFAIALVFVAVLMALDVSSLRTMMLASEIGWIALFMLTFFCGLTFASVQMGLAVIMLSEDEDETPPGGHLWARLRRLTITTFALPPKRELATIPVQTKPRPRR